MRGIIAAAIVALVACAPPPDPKTPEGAFGQLARCIDKADRRCLYDSLDRDTRWSIQTIHKTFGKMRELVERSYPVASRRNAYGVWYEEAQAADYAGAFEVYCRKRRCLEQVARGFGAVVKVSRRGDDLVDIETTRGQHFEMLWAEERWGITLFEDDLRAAKLRIIDRLGQVEKNAAQYDEQRLASGIKGDAIRYVNGKKQR